MANIQEIRQQYPQYNDLSDQQLADSMYKTHYSDMPREQFDQKIGLAPAAPAKVKQAPPKAGGIGQFGPTAMGATMSGLKDSGFLEGVKVGAEELPYGMAQAGMSVARGLGLKVPDSAAKYAADQVSKIEAQDKGTGIPGALGEMLPAAIIPTGESAKVGSLVDLLKQGAKKGAEVGGLFSAVAPTTDPNQGLGKRELGVAAGAAGGALLGGASAGVGAALGKKIPGEGKNYFQKAAQHFGMNFTGAKTDEQIAQEVNRAVGKRNSDIGSMIGDRAEEPQKKASTLGDVGRGIVSLFAKRKGEESAAWGAAEPSGNAIKHDMAPAIDKLQARLKELENATANGTGTEKAKNDLALVKDALAKLGAPVQPEQSVIEKVRDIGGRTQTSVADRQYAPKNETTTTNAEPTTVTGGKQFKETSQEPVTRTVKQEGKNRSVETSPYSVTTKVTKGEAPKPPRQGTVGDLVRTMRDVVNSDKYSGASSSVRREVRGIINDELAGVSKSNPEFSTLHTKAINWTQRNADIYKDEGKMAQYGLDEKKLWEIHNKLSQAASEPDKGARRMLGLDDVQSLNNQAENIKTREDLLEYRRLLPRPLYSTLMRTRYTTLMSDINMDVEKFKENRPLLEEMLKQSGFSKERIAQELDNYEAVAEKMTERGVDASGKLSSVEKNQNRLKEIQKAMLFGGALGNPKQGLFHGIQAIMPTPTREQLAIRGLKKEATPNALYSGTPSNIPGVMASQVIKDNQ
jgi:hypothetical protein